MGAQMMRFAIATALLASTALADIPPPTPEHPLDADCAPFTGVWAQSTPHVSRGGARSMVLAVGSEAASLVVYLNQDNIFIEAKALDGALACEATADGVTVLKFSGPNEVNVELTAKLTSETTFTTEREKPYLEPGPPPENWKGETETTTWVRVAR